MVVDYSVVLMYRAGDISWKIFDEISRAVAHGITALGYRVDLRYRDIPRHNPSILFGLQDVPEVRLEDIHPGSVIYNLEQIVEGSRGLEPAYIEKMRRMEVWDYSLRNARNLEARFGIPRVRHVPIGYSSILERIPVEAPQDVDVLFYGWINERRKKILDALKAAGLNVFTSQGLFGSEKNNMIDRSKVILNMHFYTPGIMEAVRIHELLANRKAVVCEANPGTEVHKGWEDTCLFAPYAELVDAVISLVNNPQARRERENGGYEAFKRMPYEKILENVVPYKSEVCGDVTLALPRAMTVGIDAKRFLVENFNVSADTGVPADLICDLSKRLAFGQTYKAGRFGAVTFQPSMFRTIEADNIKNGLEGLSQVIGNSFRLLEKEGELDLYVSYETYKSLDLDPEGFLECALDDEQPEWGFRWKGNEIKLSRLGRRLRRFLFLGRNSSFLYSIPGTVQFVRCFLVKTARNKVCEVLRSEDKRFSPEQIKPAKAGCQG